MIKINISFSKKIPVPGQQFSSLSFHGSMEKELSDGLSPEQIQEVYHHSYNLLEATIEKEIQDYTNAQTTPTPTSSVTSNSVTHNSTPPDKASQKQITFLNRLGAERGMAQSQVDALALNSFGVETIWQLTKKQASGLIEQLQNQRAA